MIYLNSEKGLVRFVNGIFQEKIDFTVEKDITKVAESAFKKDDSVKVVLLPHVTEIGKSAFEECLNLSAIFLKPELQDNDSGTLTLQHNCFKNCCELRDVFIQGYKKVEIEAGAFSDCIKLRNLDIDSAKLVVLTNVFSDVSDDFVLLFNSSGKKETIEKICRENEIRCAYYTGKK